MVSINWKKKRKLRTTSALDKEGEEGGDVPEEVDWLTATKKGKLMVLEDNTAKFKRLRDEGVLLAENERFWEALKCWDEALHISSNCAALHEMKAQVLLQLGEVFPAVKCAERAVELDPTWAIGRQTLGRAQLGLGEVEMALVNFEKALHLDPLNEEVKEDLGWSMQLVKQKVGRGVKT